MKRLYTAALFRGFAPSVSSRTRGLHLAPPYLVDPPYIPRAARMAAQRPDLLSRKVAKAQAALSECNMCPRKCGVNRFEKKGVCMVGDRAPVNVVAPHFGEEASLIGVNGSGTIFFSGCSLKCSFCQNHEISHSVQGYNLGPEEIGDWILKLQEAGTHNLNLVTPEHVVPQVVLALAAIADRLEMPVVYNTSSYDCQEALDLMDGLVDIYLADFKVWEPATAARLLKAKDYPEHARNAIKLMNEQVGFLRFSPDGLAKEGLLVRHLVMPGQTSEAERILEWLAKEIGTDTYVNIMQQYRPDGSVGKQDRRRDGTTTTRYEELNRAPTSEEYDAAVQAAKRAGLFRFEEAPRHGGF
ncbi:hypothetical protein DFJ74DRAFT_277202 [Hyaloraphidium curvatum]|nr:hypothetical protein DFJ74DRAFT_277202 [Hyaloraphidium curvatum]